MGDVAPGERYLITKKLLLNAGDGGDEACGRAAQRDGQYPDVAVAPPKPLMVDLPHASIHRD